MNESESDVDMYRADKIILEDTFHQYQDGRSNYDYMWESIACRFLLYFYFKYVDIARIL